MTDRADLLSDRVEEQAIAKCADLYSDALKRVMRRYASVFDDLKALETKKPPSNYATQEAQDQWREWQRRHIIRKSGIAKAISREIAAAGVSAAGVIRKAMDEIDHINRVVDDIG